MFTVYLVLLTKLTGKKLSRVKLLHINRFLIVAIVVLNIHILAAPLQPAISLWWQTHINHRQEKLTRVINSSGTNIPGVTIPDGEHLIVPSIALDEVIYEGTSKYTLDKGVWRYPKSSTPDKHGNTVLVGHRFTYSGASVFFNLDKLSNGTKIAVFWNKEKFSYTVTETKVVPPSATDIQQNTNDDRLTLYTCTPLWTDKNRLVVIAKRDINER